MAVIVHSLTNKIHLLSKHGQEFNLIYIFKKEVGINSKLCVQSLNIVKKFIQEFETWTRREILHYDQNEKFGTNFWAQPLSLEELQSLCFACILQQDESPPACWLPQTGHTLLDCSSYAVPGADFSGCLKPFLQNKGASLHLQGICHQIP